ncbi:MAG TPA: HAD family hydrolase, partial [Treponema sp.]|nr:HAD family hydrolase [Treponema sp.]
GVENYISILDRNGYFEVTSFSKEDLKRTELYKENMKRAVQKAAFSDYGEYLDSLEMTAYIRDFDKVAMQRITQLTNKSNQFNVTTKRYTLEEMEQTAADPDSIRLYGRLIDKFGDNGIVSVVIGEKDGEALNIVLWLMSCRVLKRDMELAMLDELAAKASEAGLKKLKGWYYPTAKNNMVRGLYESFGFSKVEEKEDGSALWELDLAGYQNKNTHINVTREVFE